MKYEKIEVDFFYDCNTSLLMSLESKKMYFLKDFLKISPLNYVNPVQTHSQKDFTYE